jgi:hypothetical protein
MSWAHVQGTLVQGPSGTVVSATFGSPVTAGNLICVGVTNYGTSTIVCKDLTNNINYAQAVLSQYGDNQTAIFWYVPPTGGSSFIVRVTLGAYGYSSITIDEYSYTSGSTVVVDSYGTGGSTGTTQTLSGNLTVTGTDLIFATVGGNQTPSAGSGFTQRGQGADTGSAWSICSEDSLNATSNVNPTFTSNSMPYAMAGVAFLAQVQSFTYSAAGLAISGAWGTGTAGPSPGVAGLAISSYPGGAVFPGIISAAAGLAISGAPGTGTAGPSPGVAGLAISGGYSGAVFPGIISSAAGLAIAGASGTGTAGPSPGVAGLAISGGYGGAVFPGIISSAAGLAIAGASGTGTAGPSPGVAGMAITGGQGGAVFPGITVLLVGLGISGAPGGATGGEFLGAFYLPYEYTSVLIETGNTNPFGIDPEKTTIITVGLTPAD